MTEGSSSSARVARGEASARVALAGNPSDGYGGAVLALTVPSFSAVATACPSAAGPVVEPESELLRAAADRFLRDVAPRAGHAHLSWSTSIPRGVGLGGSSALVIAALRSLCRLHAVQLEASRLAELALAVEVEELGIEAGLQDRVAQAYGGLTFMDFGSGRYESLDARSLSPLLVAWRTETAAESGAVHAGLRRRYSSGEDGVGEVMRSLAACAHRARAAVLAGDGAGLARCADESFDLRERVMELDPRHVEMIRCARSCGAGANYAGSGGAIVAVCPTVGVLEAAERELGRLGCEVSVL